MVFSIRHQVSGIKRKNFVVDLQGWTLQYDMLRLTFKGWTLQHASWNILWNLRLVFVCGVW